MRNPKAASGAVPRAATSACVLAAAAISFASAPAVLPSAHAAPLAHTQGCLDGFDCDMSSRIASVNSYLSSRPGVTGYVLRDRVSGGVYANEHAEDMVWTASTIKLAIAADLLNRARVGAIGLSPEDRGLIESMLATSNDQATDVLWNKYAGLDRMAFNNAFRANGMTSLDPQPTNTALYPDWSFQKCTTADLDRLMSHVLDKMHPDDRNYLLDRMRKVDSNQHWGVWGAGAAMRPGLKNGWSAEQGGWVVNSVGFAGPGERYTLSIMTSMGSEGGYTDGADTDTKVAELLLSGR
ncbi:tat pathway signal sequence [Nocardia donostiensis]|uniref:Tat pathway signal sequence n=1 Tax=Nocardia donostiensis TaxID=1538463 RepID=A0A1V2TH74_9NOCA|nr:tat pathway signal sequence [Nocardia donostiensis]ONM48870.1 tat pathway signal sequence [Nocardia donostiensis]OQS15509.1 tat pathway signal sequence [Nocardia donostiensis]OQS22874.1 tat pathway signal sequence [Nocardia donostiensis]